MFLDMNVSVALDYSTDKEICNETKVSHRPVALLEESKEDQVDSHGGSWRGTGS